MCVKRHTVGCIIALFVAFNAIHSVVARRGSHAHKHLSEREQHCRDARHPIFIVPGIMGSDLDVRLMTNTRSKAPCSIRRPSKLSLWPPFSPDLLRNSACFMYLLQPVPCDSSSGSSRGGHHRPRLCNNAGVSMFVNPGGEAGTDTFAFKQGGYTQLTRFLRSQFGYELGKDLFAAPYDWRLTLQALEESGQYESMAARIQAAVQRNCGKKAVIIGHSMGTLVSLGLMQSPTYQTWRAANVQGYIALAPPYGGSTYAIASKLGGARMNLLDFIGDLLQPIINEMVYHGSRGLPSMLMLMPNRHLWGKDFVLVHTPGHNYTLGELKDLFKDTGDMQAVELYEQAQILGNLLSQGPVPGVDTYCIYGAAMPTVQSWSYKALVQGRPAPVGSADAVQTGMGDGVVNVESMRLCKKLTNESRIFELGPGVDHGSILSHPQSLAAVSSVLSLMLAGKQPGPWQQLEEYDQLESGQVGPEEGEAPEGSAADAVNRQVGPQQQQQQQQHGESDWQESGRVEQDDQQDRGQIGEGHEQHERPLQHEGGSAAKGAEAGPRADASSSSSSGGVGPADSSSTGKGPIQG